MGRREAGQSLVELALLLPLLLLILLGCLDLGRVFAVYLVLTNGTREGARYASLYPHDLNEIRNRTRADILAEGLAEASLQVQVATPQGTAGGRPVAVTAQYTFPMTTLYLFGGQPLLLRATTQMVILGGS